MTPLSPDEVRRQEDWLVEEGVRCVVAPCCAFTFDAGHTDTDVDSGTYSCPCCAEMRMRAENERLREAMTSWHDLAREAGSLYESTLRFQIAKTHERTIPALSQDQGETGG
jgi:hypothetical protein